MSADLIKAGIKAVFQPGDIVEVRCWDKDRKVYTGRYPYSKGLVAALDIFDEGGCDCYYVLNPVVLTNLKLRDILQGGLCSWEKDIPFRKRFLLDFDPKRDNKIASPEQKASAETAARAAYDWLQGMGWQDIIPASSGNGIHLLPRIDLPNTPEAKQLITKLQRIISNKFSTPECECECFPDSNRLVRAYGTLNKKGTETEDIKYNRSGILDWPKTETPQPVADICRRIIAENPLPDLVTVHHVNDGEGGWTREILEERLEAWEENIIEFKFSETPRRDGFRVMCPGNLADGWPDGEAHDDIYDSPNDSSIVFIKNGFPCFQCNHNHCGEGAAHGKKTWKDLQEYYDPERKYHTMAAPEIPPGGYPGFEMEGDRDVESAILLIFPGAREITGEEEKQPTTPTGILGPMPETAMYGWLADAARQLNVPLGYAYPAVLTAYAAAGHLGVAPTKSVRPTLYCCLIGGVHCGKSEAQDRAVAMMRYPKADTVVTGAPGSDRGLILVLGGGRKKKKKKSAGDEAAEEEQPLVQKLLVMDELRKTFSKIEIRNSSLASLMCELWKKDDASAATRDGEDVLKVRLSILGALKAANPEEFQEVFGRDTTSGLYDRFIFGVAPKGWGWDVWEPSTSTHRFPKSTILPLSCIEMMKVWRDQDAIRRGRLGEIALRIAVITASANHDSEVSEECMRRALEFMAWQEQIRARYCAGMGIDADAQCTETILASLAEQHAVGVEWVPFTKLCQNRNWYKKFSATRVSRVRKSLTEEGALLEEYKESEDKEYDEQGHPKEAKPKKTGRVKLAKEDL